jgi:hypothetical protein
MLRSACWNRSRSRIAALGALALSGPAMAGCSWFESSTPHPCPRVSILADAAQVIQFRPGGGHDVTDVAYKGEVSAVASECKYIKDNKVIDMTVTITLVAVRGSSAQPGDVNLPFFVAVVDRKTQEILNKNSFQSPVPFPEGRRRSGVAEEISERIPLAAGKTAADYEVLVGLQLTEAQLEEMRKLRGS